MKFLRKFDTHADYEAYMRGSEVFLPNVSKCSDDEPNVVHYNPIEIQSSNEIWYTSTDGNVIEVSQESFTETIVSNIYENGKGKIKFASDLTGIGENAFKEKNLQSIIIPGAVTTIGINAFSTSSLNEIVYLGTQDGYKSITFANDYLTGTSIYEITCSDGTLSLILFFTVKYMSYTGAVKPVKSIDCRHKTSYLETPPSVRGYVTPAAKYINASFNESANTTTFLYVKS